MNHRPFRFKSVTNLDIQRTKETHASSLIIHANHDSGSLLMILFNLFLLFYPFHLLLQIPRAKLVRPCLPLQYHVAY